LEFFASHTINYNVIYGSVNIVYDITLSIDFCEDLNIFMYRRRLEMAQDGSEKAIKGK
jgi:hypothetical protein